jgi:spore coat polysaccharide biosynthesis protein SpsF
MTTVAIIQARMGSQRLPGKVLADLCGAPVLQRVIERTQRAESIDEVMVATTERDEDDAVAQLASKCGAAVFRGSSPDVLLRYVGAAKAASADVVVRITADCPLIDPDVIDIVVSHLSRTVDYVSNVVKRSYPRGLDVEAMPHDVLERADRLASSQPAREHVTLAIYEERPELFVIKHVQDNEDNSDLNFCVDTEADLHYMRKLWQDHTDYRGMIERARSHV